MASEVSHRHSATAETLYFTIRNVSRQMWNTAGTPAFETVTVANWGDYDVAMSESPASSYFYVGTFPAISGNMVAGWYWVEVFKRASGSPAISDVMQASFFGYWDGATYKWWADDTTHIGGTLQTARDIGASVLLASTGLDAITQSATGMVEIAKAVWDRVLTGALHNIVNSAGRRLRTLGVSTLDDGTAQTGGADSITLASSASTTAGIYVGCLVTIETGAGAGQSRYIVGYTSGRIAYVARHWLVAPDITSTYAVYGDNQVPFIHMGLASDGGASTITLQSTSPGAASATNDIYAGQLIRILSGNGDDQIRLITAYNGTTKVATVSPAWTTAPTSASYYGTLQNGIARVDAMSAGVIANATLNADVGSTAYATNILALAVNKANVRSVAEGTVAAVTTAADFTLTSTDLSVNNDDYNNMWLVFTSGGNKFIPRLIQDYVGAGKQVLFTGTGLKGAFPQTVTAGDTWQILAGGQ